MDELSAKQYKARKYASGSSDAEPITVSIRDEKFHVVDSKGAEIVYPMTTVSLKLGGSSSDRVVLEMQKTGDTIIVSDLEFLKVLKKAQATSAITRQVSRAETARTFNKLQGFMLLGLVLFVVCLFGGCIFVGAILEPERESREAANNPTANSATKEPSSTQAPQSKAETPEAKESREYDAKVKTILLKAWPTPPKGDYSTVIVQITLAKNGKVKNVTLVQPSGNSKTDKSAIAAVRKSSPLPAPPSSWTEEPITLMFTFNPLDKQAK